MAWPEERLTIHGAPACLWSSAKPHGTGAKFTSSADREKIGTHVDIIRGHRHELTSGRRRDMDANVKKTVLRMIPYGLYVLTAKGKDDAVAAATVNWVTQASFAPPLVVVGVKTDSHAHALIKESKAFALNVLGQGQQ